jgi:hypothetical protein
METEGVEMSGAGLGLLQMSVKVGRSNKRVKRVKGRLGECWQEFSEAVAGRLQFDFPVKSS